MQGLLLSSMLWAALQSPDVPERLDSAVVSASRAGKSTPVTYTMVSKEELRTSNPLNSLPMTLGLQPSVVVSNEGGTGLGYSKMTVRGSKGSQINVTLNGITLNDSESQEVFWVNIPALGSILSSVQVQRGLGTSASGAGAFGASINMNTSFVSAEPFANAEFARGTFNTFTSAVSAGTGLLPGGLYFSGAYSYDRTDGYIRNAWAKVQSAFAVLGWLQGPNSLRLTYLMGNQHTGITWKGLPYGKYLAGEYTYNGAGQYHDEFGNEKYYENESDNYTQHHLQFNWSHQFGESLTWSTTLNYTKGDGYYDQLKGYSDRSKAEEAFTEYGLAVPSAVREGSWKEIDFITQKCMDNWYLVGKSDLRYRRDRMNLAGGVYLSHYDGAHPGYVRWVNVLGAVDQGPWYSNRGVKKELNLYAKGEYLIYEILTAYVDLQYRGISLKMTGEDDDGYSLAYEARWNFFNPRAGLTCEFGREHKAYASAAFGRREPGRADLKENIKSGAVALKPESMVDVEAGYTYESERFSGSANLYLMEYRDMLLENGRINPTGNAVKENVPRSWRRGVELAAVWRPLSLLQIEGNITLSTNKIKDYTMYYEDWENGGYRPESYGRTAMLMSPSAVGMARVTLAPFVHARGTALSIDGKYVGRQYWDNTESKDRSIPSYFVMNLSLTHAFPLREGVMELTGYIANLLNARYYADAWVYRAYQGGDDPWYEDNGVFPSAPRSCMLKVSYRF